MKPLPPGPWHDPTVEWRCEQHPDVLLDDCILERDCPGPGVPYRDGKPLPVPA